MAIQRNQSCISCKDGRLEGRIFAGKLLLKCTKCGAEYAEDLNQSERQPDAPTVTNVHVTVEQQDKSDGWVGGCATLVVIVIILFIVAAVCAA